MEPVHSLNSTSKSGKADSLTRSGNDNAPSLASAKQGDQTITRLPSFIAVGPTRTGTTWLHQFLVGSVGLPANIKETNFFDRDYDKGLSLYAKYFANCPGEKPAGEIAPTYFYNREARERIARDIPGCRIIITLRDPVERQYSLYRLSVWNGRTTVSFAEATEKHWAEIIDACDYAKYVRLWQATFGEARVLVVLYDDFVASPQSYISQICDFIGIPTIDVRRAPVAPEQRVHALKQMPRGTAFGRFLRWFFRLGKDRPDKFEAFLHWVRRHGAQRMVEIAARTSLGKQLRKVVFTEMPSLDTQTAVRLRTAIGPQIEATEALLGRDLSAWKSGTEVNTVSAETNVAT